MSSERLKFGGPPETPEEENDFLLDRNTYLLEHIGIDQLTGLKNRNAFENELGKSLQAIRTGKNREDVEGHSRVDGDPLKEISLVFIDLDNFKQVNDTRGHLKGDEGLRKVAEILTKSVREADVVARFGGDEFYILLPRANAEDGKTIADKIRINIENDPKLNELGITASIGVRSVDASNLADSTTLITHADEAAYAAKRKGKNRVEVHNENGI